MGAKLVEGMLQPANQIYCVLWKRKGFGKTNEMFAQILANFRRRGVGKLISHITTQSRQAQRLNLTMHCWKDSVT